MPPFAICGNTLFTRYDYPCLEMICMHNLVAERVRATHSVFGIYISVCVCVCVDVVRLHWSHMTSFHSVPRSQLIYSCISLSFSCSHCACRVSPAGLWREHQRWTEIDVYSLWVYPSGKAIKGLSWTVSGFSWFRRIARSLSQQYFSRCRVLWI